MEADDWLWPSLERTDVFVFHQRNNREKKNKFGLNIFFNVEQVLEHF